MDNSHKYDDMLYLPHHVSPTRVRMPIGDRAAQFAPFQAMVGYGDAVKEASRLTDEMVELDENRKSMLNEKLQMILEMGGSSPEVTITYFVPDQRKEGGSYLTITGEIKKVDEYEQMIVMMDGCRIPLNRVIEID